jgi:hypothetical protein
MSAVPALAIPYEKQGELPNGRMCGAAALSMVYRSFQKPVAQAEIWPKIAKHNRFGSLTSATHLMTQDALQRGFAALAIQAANPLVVLRRCQDSGIRVILNHRLKEDVAAGHYTVLVDLADDHVVLHDPFFGPSRRVPHAALLDLWRPRYLNAEIAGNILIGIARAPTVPPPCPLCRTPIPPHVNCPQCAKPVPLQPTSLLGCVGRDCPGRLWHHVCCPFCDFTWSFATGEAQAEAAPDRGAASLERACTEIDKFCDLLLSYPQLANNPQLKQQVELLRASKGQMKMAQSEAAYHGKVKQAQREQLVQKNKEDKAAFLKKQEELAKPAPSLDGNALGRELLTDLGLLGGAKVQAKTDLEKADDEATKQGEPKGTQTVKVDTGDPAIMEYLKKQGLWK